MLTPHDLRRFLAETARPPVHLGADELVDVQLVRAGGSLFEEGSDSDSAYVLLDGLLEVVDTLAGFSRRLAWIPRGAWVGEIAALTGAPRNATVRAWRDSLVLCVSAARCQALLAGAAEGIPALAQHLLSRGRRSHEARPAPFVVTFLPVDDVTAAEATAWLEAAAGSAPDTVVVSSAGAEALADDRARVRWFEGRAGAGLCAVVADAEPTEWTRMVTRSADRVVLLARATGSGALSPLEQALGLPAAARSLELVLVEDRAAESREDGLTWTRLRGLTQVRGLGADVGPSLTLLLDGLRTDHLATDRLRRFDLLEDLDEAALSVVQEKITWQHVEGGELLIRAGDAAKGVYLLDYGRLEITAEGRHLARVGPGALVGETALLAERPRTANVRASRDSLVGFVSQGDFRELMTTLPGLSRNAARALAQRVPGADRVRRSVGPSNLAVVPLDPSPRALALGRALVATLTEVLGYRVAYVDDAAVTAALGPGMAARGSGEVGYPDLLAWLHRIEADHDITVYASGTEDGPWARRCLRQADRVIFVAEASGDPGLRPLERLIREGLATQTPVDLFLLQPDGISEASGTEAWLTPRPDVEHHHLRANTPADLAAATRRAMGQAIGVAMAGASSRGVGHLGTLRALEALGIPVDIVTGSSSGSAAAASCAMRIPHERMLVVGGEMSEAVRLKWTRLQPPLIAMTSGKAVDEFVHGLFGEHRLEDQILPAILTAVDISRNQVVYLRRGLLWKAMRASGSIPMLYPPVTMNDQVLVDGGVISYTGVEAMAEHCARGLTVISNLDPEEFQPEVAFAGHTPYGTRLSGWRQLALRIIPGMKPEAVPGMMEILFRTMCIRSFEDHARISRSDGQPGVCHVKSPVGGYGLFEVDAKVGLEIERITFETAMATLSSHPFVQKHFPSPGG